MHPNSFNFVFLSVSSSMCVCVSQCDLQPRPVPREDIDQFSREQGFLRWSEISVKDDLGVSESMK